jgi:hypothetical protein
MIVSTLTPTIRSDPHVVQAAVTGGLQPKSQAALMLEALMQTTETTRGGGVATDETNRLISSDKVEGTAVYNRQGEHLGKVYTLMLDKHTGRLSTR